MFIAFEGTDSEENAVQLGLEKAIVETFWAKVGIGFTGLPILLRDSFIDFFCFYLYNK